MATGSADMLIHVWNVSKAHLGMAGTIKTLRGHRGPICSLTALGPCLLASASDDKTVRVWNPLTSSLLHTIQTHAECITALPDPGTAIRLSDRFCAREVLCDDISVVIEFMVVR
jgi:WD40 repeat protein